MATDDVVALVFRQLTASHDIVLTAVTKVPQDLTIEEVGFPYSFLEAVKENFCKQFAEFQHAKWWVQVSPVQNYVYGQDVQLHVDPRYDLAIKPPQA